MPPLKQTAFRLTEGDLDILDRVKDGLDYPTRTEALRHILRKFAEQNHVTWSGTKATPKPKRSKQKR